MTSENSELTLGQSISQPQQQNTVSMGVKDAIDSGVAENLKKVLEEKSQHAFAVRAPIADRMLLVEKDTNTWQKPLSYAVAVGSADMVAVLLEAGAKVTPSIVAEAQEKYANALPEAISEESQKVKLLLAVVPGEKQALEEASNSQNGVSVENVSEKKANQHMKLK